ncbi:hypothetical protein Vretifemale_18127, partial [Volvox reticuliferus]
PQPQPPPQQQKRRLQLRQQLKQLRQQRRAALNSTAAPATAHLPPPVVLLHSLPPPLLVPVITSAMPREPRQSTVDPAANQSLIMNPADCAKPIPEEYPAGAYSNRGGDLLGMKSAAALRRAEPR